MPNPKNRYKEQVLQLKYTAVMSAVNQLLAKKGYDNMTVDEVAELAGMSKASLYKLYSSKEELAGAAMIDVLDLALALVNDLRLQNDPSPLNKLKTVTRWAMQTKLESKMPSLPAQNSNLSEALKANEAYMERLFDLSMKLSVWIADAQNNGQLRTELPTDFILYNLYGRACDPVLEAMSADGQYNHEQILDMMTLAHFNGLAE